MGSSHTRACNSAAAVRSFTEPASLKLSLSLYLSIYLSVSTQLSPPDPDNSLGSKEPHRSVQSFQKCAWSQSQVLLIHAFFSLMHIKKDSMRDWSCQLPVESGLSFCWEGASEGEDLTLQCQQTESLTSRRSLRVSDMKICFQKCPE